MSNPMPPMPSPRPTAIPVDTSSSGVWDRLSSWVSENKAVVYTIAGVAVVVTGAGVVYYLNGDSVSLPSPLLSGLDRNSNCTILLYAPRILESNTHARFRPQSQTRPRNSAKRRGGSERKPSARQPKPRRPPRRLSPRPPLSRANRTSLMLTRTLSLP